MANRKQKQTFLEVVVLGIINIFVQLFKLAFRGISGKRGITVSDRQYITKKRQEIEQMAGSNNVHELKQAVFEADKLVNYILENLGFVGDTFAEKMNTARGKINPEIYEGIWQGHKVRNRLAHESDFEVTSSELKQATEKLLRFTRSA
jgi:hypothetical protein